MDKDDKILLWLDSFDFMTYRQKQKMLDLFEKPSDIFEANGLLKNKSDILNLRPQQGTKRELKGERNRS